MGDDVDSLIAWKAELTTPLERLLRCLDVLVGVSGATVNLALICYVCSRQKRMLRSSRTSHNLAVVSVAMADVVLTSLIAWSSWLAERPSVTNESTAKYMCKLNRYLYTWMGVVIIYSIVAMFLTKYVKFKATHKYSCVTTPSIFTLSVIWYFGAGFNVWQLMLYSTRYTIVSAYGHAYNTTAVRRCLPIVNDAPPLGLIGQKVLTSLDLCVTYVIPVFLTGFLVCGVVNAPLWSRKRVKDKKQLTMTMVFLGIYLICKLPLELFDKTRDWMPYTTHATPSHAHLYRESTEHPHQHAHLSAGVHGLLTRHVLTTFSALSSLLNPIAYAVFSPELRNAVGAWRRKRRAKRIACATNASETGSEAPEPHQRSTLNRQNGDAITIIVEFHD